MREEIFADALAFVTSVNHLVSNSPDAAVARVEAQGKR